MRLIIYTTGAHLQPMKVKNRCGKEYWVWTVIEFTDDSFKDGEVFNPLETAESLDDFFNTTADE